MIIITTIIVIVIILLCCRLHHSLAKWETLWLPVFWQLYLSRSCLHGQFQAATRSLHWPSIIVTLTTMLIVMVIGGPLDALQLDPHSNVQRNASLAMTILLTIFTLTSSRRAQHSASSTDCRPIWWLFSRSRMRLGWRPLRWLLIQCLGYEGLW